MNSLEGGDIIGLYVIWGMSASDFSVLDIRTMYIYAGCSTCS
jgi:hypothetical protein